MPNINFIDLEIRIFKRDPFGYPVEIRVEGQQELGRGYMTSDILDWVSLGDARRDGQRLFEALFADPNLRAAWNRALGQSVSRRIRLWLNADTPELHTQSWELLHDGATWLAADSATPFSRYLELQEQWGQSILERPLSMLVAIANPYNLTAYNLAPLDMEAEHAHLAATLRDLPVLPVFLEPPVTLNHIENELRMGDYHILHLVAHGAFNQHRQQTALYLADASGKTQLVSDAKIAATFQRMGKQSPHLIFLAACESATRSTLNAFTGLAPHLIQAGVPAIVGMQDKLSISTTQTLTHAFYKELFRSGAVDRALNAARSLLLAEGYVDAAVPVLLMRLKAGQLLEVQEEVVTPKSSAFTRLLKWFTDGFQALFYGRRYQQHLYEQHHYFDVAELITQGAFALESKSIFVQLDLAPLPPQAVPSAVVSSEMDIYTKDTRLHQDCKTIWDYLQAKELSQQHIAILAGPGYGKTTLLKHIALTLATAKSRKGRYNVSRQLPIFLFLRDHAARIRMALAETGREVTPFTLAQAIQDSIMKYSGPLVSPHWFSRRLKRGYCIVLLDGLDEIVQPALRKHIVTWIEKQMLAYPQARFIITSRPYGYYENPLDRVMVLGVMHFGMEQIHQFIQNWYLATCIKEAQDDTPTVHEQAESETLDLLQRLQETATLYGLATNPLLLTMIVHVHHYGGVLPKRRVDLYAEAYTVLLCKRSEAQYLSPLEKQRVLQGLAYEMMCERIHEIPSVQAITIIEPTLLAYRDDISGGEFLKNIENLSGLMWERERDTYSFAHLTFQEYLAAVHVRESQLIEDLVQRIDDVWWHETIRLYCAQADATPIVRACLVDDRISDITFRLALYCVDEALTLHPMVQRQLEAVLHRCFDNAKLKTIIATALADIRRERMLRVSQDKFLDSHFITHAEYLLFLLDCRAVGDYYQPDHWRDWHLIIGDAIRPIMGVRPADALAFCEWLNQQEPTEDWCYRLPTIEEMEQEKIFNIQPEGEANYWVTDADEFQNHGVRKLHITVESILQKVGVDMRREFAAFMIWELFFKRPKLITPQALAARAAKYDFERLQARLLLTKIRKLFANEAVLQRAEEIAKTLEPLIVDYRRYAGDYNVKCQEIMQAISELKNIIADYEHQRDAAHAGVEAQKSQADSQLDGWIAKQEAIIADYAQQRDEAYTAIEANRSQVDSQLDEWIAKQEAIIADYERQRDEVHAEIEANRSQADSQLDEWISEQPEHRAEYESQRSQVHADLDANRDQVDSQVESWISDHRGIIADYEQQRTQKHTELEMARERVSDNFNTFTSKSRTFIANYEQQRTDLHAKIDTEHARIDQLFKQWVAEPRSGIAQNESVLSDYRTQEQAADQKAYELQRFVTEIPENLQKALAVLPEIEGFIENYFHIDRKRIVEVEDAFRATKRLTQALMVFVEENVSCSTEYKAFLEEFADLVDQIFTSVQNIRLIITFSLELESGLRSTLPQITGLQFKSLKSMHTARQVQHQLAVSFELAYEFLRLRSRSLLEQSPSQHMLDRLCYVRKCALTLAMELLAHQPQAPEILEARQECLKVYIELCILEERIRGNIPAIEGIRLVRERTKQNR